MKTYLYRASTLKSTITFSGFSFIAEVNFWRPPKTVVSCENSSESAVALSIIYVRSARVVPPTNTNFRLTFIY